MGNEGAVHFPIVDNGRFYVAPQYRIENQNSVNLTVEEHIVTQVRSDQECCSAEITAKGSIDGKPKWTIQKKASHAEMFDRFYRTVTFGCCGATTRYAYFDPLTGNQSFIASEPIASLVLVGSYGLSRYLALNRLSEPGDEQFVLEIQYGPQSGPSQTTYLVFPGEDEAHDQVTVEYLKDGKLERSTYSDQGGTYPNDFTLAPPGYPSSTHTSPDDITGFFFVLNVANKPPIKIPVVKDHLDLANTTLPKGFQIIQTVPADLKQYLEDMHK
jgi:hypothetical protein